MARTDQQRTELEKLGVRLVVMKLVASGYDRGAEVYGFKGLLRGDAEDWLVEQEQDEHDSRPRRCAWRRRRTRNRPKRSAGRRSRASGRGWRSARARSP